MSLNSLKTTSRKKKHTEAIRRTNNDPKRQESFTELFKISKLTKFDFLGAPVTFNYKGSRSYDSFVGCLCSLIVVVSLLAYVVTQLVIMKANSSSIVASV